jgi:hypothetical protein
MRLSCYFTLWTIITWTKVACFNTVFFHTLFQDHCCFHIKSPQGHHIGINETRTSDVISLCRISLKTGKWIQKLPGDTHHVSGNNLKHPPPIDVRNSLFWRLTFPFNATFPQQSDVRLRIQTPIMALTSITSYTGQQTGWPSVMHKQTNRYVIRPLGMDEMWYTLWCRLLG